MEPIRDEATRYRSYLLRCWEARGERPRQPGKWRFSLECVQTGEKRGFPELANLVGFLQGELNRTIEKPIEEPSEES
jgi:hypothetical protein